jgi:hypothetical protein
LKFGDKFNIFMKSNFGTGAGEPWHSNGSLWLMSGGHSCSAGGRIPRIPA